MLPPTPSPSPPPAAIMSGATAISPTPTSAIEEELTTALHEALTCTGCTAILRIPKSTFRADTASGRYDPARTVPFNPSQADPDLAPHEMPPATSSQDDEMDLEADDAVHFGRQARCLTPETPKTQVEQQQQQQQQQHRHISYAELTPPSTPPSSGSAQGHLYEALVARYLLEGEDDTSDDESNSEDVAFAKYRADYHIHVHYTLRRGILSICRDGKDVYELKGWKGRLHAVDSGLIDLEELESGMMDWRYGIIREKGGGGTVGKGEGGYYSSNPYQSYYPALSPMAALPRTQKLGGWPDDANQLMASQVALWRKRGLSRQRRVEDVRIRWAFIMEERRRQRLGALAQAQQHKATSSVKVRLYCSQAGGDRNFIREIEMDARSFGELIT